MELFTISRSVDPGSPADSVARTIVADVCTEQVLWDTPDFVYSMGLESFCLCRCAGQRFQQDVNWLIARRLSQWRP